MPTVSATHSRCRTKLAAGQFSLQPLSVLSVRPSRFSITLMRYAADSVRFISCPGGPTQLSQRFLMPVNSCICDDWSSLWRRYGKIYIVAALTVGWLCDLTRYRCENWINRRCRAYTGRCAGCVMLLWRHVIARGIQWLQAYGTGLRVLNGIE